VGTRRAGLLPHFRMTVSKVEDFLCVYIVDTMRQESKCFESLSWIFDEQGLESPLHRRGRTLSSRRLKLQCLDARKGLAGLRRSPRLPKIVGGLLSKPHFSGSAMVAPKPTLKAQCH